MSSANFSPTEGSVSLALLVSKGTTVTEVNLFKSGNAVLPALSGAAWVDDFVGSVVVHPVKTVPIKITRLTRRIRFVFIKVRLGCLSYLLCPFAAIPCARPGRL